MRLIDADALPIDVMLIDDEEELVFVSQYDIDHAPTVDAVPVVRCKDCTYYDSEPGGDIMMCYNGLGWTEQNDFCSKGERRGEKWEDQMT